MVLKKMVRHDHLYQLETTEKRLNGSTPSKNKRNTLKKSKTRKEQ